METINHNNDSRFFTERDMDNFGNIVGISIDDLRKQIKKQSELKINQIYSNQKFVYSDLNKSGLHIYRILLARRIRMSSKSLPITAVEEFNQKGIVHIENFLSDVEFNHVTEYFNTTVKDFFPDGGKGTINPDFILGDTNPLLSLFRACARVNEFSDDAVDGYPRTEFWHHKHFKNDPQYKFHTDTFQPTVKAWLYLEDVEYEHGPFHYIPTSNIPDKKRLTWDYENSLVAEDGRRHPLWNIRVENNGKPGSFRICENSGTQQEMLSIGSMGYEEVQVAVAPKNTLLIADTFGLHKRGTANPNTMRSTLTMQYRPQAFRCY